MKLLAQILPFPAAAGRRVLSGARTRVPSPLSTAPSAFAPSWGIRTPASQGAAKSFALVISFPRNGYVSRRAAARKKSLHFQNGPEDAA